MPLLDHFRPPWVDRRFWDSFYAMWAVSIADALNGDLLPPDDFAELRIRFSREGLLVPERDDSKSTGQGYVPPEPARTLRAVFPDEIEVRAYSKEDGRALIAVVGLITPGNKDSHEVRRAHAARCAAYLQREIGLVVIDFVTNHGGNLHDDLMDLLGYGEAARFHSESALYAVAYRPNRLARRPTGTLDVWMAPLTVGEALPTMPLALRDGPCMPIDLEATYSEARQRSRLAYY